jgi:branched-chain amino acid transport system permease protein
VTSFIIQTLNGLSMAGLLFLLGAGFTLIFGVMRVVNLAHGALYLLGGYFGLSVLTATGNFALALLAGALGIVIVGFGLERLMRIVRDNPLAQVLLSIGVAIAIGDIILAIWEGWPRRIVAPEIMSGTVSIFGITYPRYRSLLVVIGLVVALLLWLLLDRTTLGTALRAGVDDREMVQAQGIHIGVLFTFAFSIGAALAGMAGVLGGGFLTLYPGADWEILVLALVVVVIGGLGNLGGALIASVFVGVVDAYGRWLIPELSYFMIFAPMAVLLTVRPEGIFGTKGRA